MTSKTTFSKNVNPMKYPVHIYKYKYKYIYIYIYVIYKYIYDI